jgi:hypothetical protein
VIIINESLLKEYRVPGCCEMCGLPCRSREPAHAISRRKGSGTRLDIPLNLAALGTAYECECHANLHSGKAPANALFAVIGRREGLAAEDVQERLWRIIRAPKECRLCNECEGTGHDPQYERVLITCAFCDGVGILDSQGQPWREQERKFR